MVTGNSYDGWIRNGPRQSRRHNKGEGGIRYIASSGHLNKRGQYEDSAAGNWSKMGVAAREAVPNVTIGDGGTLDTWVNK